MSFDILEQQLQHYRALASHTNSALATRLVEVQAWQKQRMQTLHAKLFAEPKNQIMTQYFLNRLYGGPDFGILADQFERVINFAHKVEKLAPATAISTATQGVRVAVLAIALDEDLAAWINTQIAPSEPINDAIMIQSILATHQEEQRYLQMDLLDQLGVGLDKYMRSFLVQSAFKLAKSAAYRKNFVPMYDFVAEGFAAMKPLHSAKDFIGVFTARERMVISQVMQGKENPLAVDNA